MYQYDVSAADPNLDALEYGIVTTAPGMRIDPNTGLISWTPVAGNYEVMAAVEDAGGLMNSQTFTVIVDAANEPPVADAGPDQSVSVSQTVTLDGSGSSDADNDPLTYLWSMESAPLGSGATLSDPTAVTPGFVADLQGTYVVQLIVNDGLENSAALHFGVAVTRRRLV
jgi:hypothetical protein